jgi:carboxymethylenebutenolidase
VDAVVVYYGGLVTDPAQLAPLRAPLLGNFGELDEGIPPATVRAFEDALRAAGKAYDIRIYKHAKHAFANPNRTEAHREGDARHAWQRSLDFLRRHLARQE